ncbi:carbohydrate sulfotransferase 14-like [Mercenaria mercenaria]|uniref:carbohydrate sulfotransferase 14-like n=1 Tax=Mercenaria mercenaria TaxID=6596 RepID=UPI001E1DC9DF|nr:carbohydrate sulfotransferase 14-like [Mercenaria mercenaria]XP_045160643.1 carbohydrate sulfotransferase 14-like [Mercenaria mercenaria]
MVFHSNGGMLDNLRLIELYNNASLGNTENKEDQMKARKDLLENVCSVMNENKSVNPAFTKSFRNEYLVHVIANREKKFLYCYLPKIANTNFRRVILGLNGVVPKEKVGSVDGADVYEKYDKQFQYLKQTDNDKVEEMIQNFKKFIVVRNPLVRLLSAYLNKFQQHPLDEERRKFYERIPKFYSKYPQLKRSFWKTLDFRSKSLTFEDFLAYWTDSFEMNSYLNEHFVPYFLLCNPCDITYDYIAKLETLYSDVDFIFEKLNIDIPFPGRNDNYSISNTDELVEKYYKTIPESLTEKVWHILKFDFLMFGYNLPEWLKAKLNLR